MTREEQIQELGRLALEFKNLRTTFTELLSNLVYGMVLIRRRACMDRCDCLIRFH